MGDVLFVNEIKQASLAGVYENESKRLERGRKLRQAIMLISYLKPAGMDRRIGFRSVEKK